MSNPTSNPTSTRIQWTASSRFENRASGSRSFSLSLSSTGGLAGADVDPPVTHHVGPLQVQLVLLGRLE